MCQTDVDQDGYHAEADCEGGVDCDDGDPAVHPGATEDGFDPVDDDCDGVGTIRRDWVTSFDSATGWQLSHATVTGGQLKVTATRAAQATATFQTPLPWSTGAPILTFAASGGAKADKVTPGVTSGCKLVVGSDASTKVIRSDVGTGVRSVDLSSVVPPDSTITTLRFACAKGSPPLTIDWMTLQNGAYPFAPLGDLWLTFETMGLPGMGLRGFVDTGEDGTVLLQGSDVGGFAWSVDGFAWHTGNGDWDDWNTPADHGVWAAWSDATATGETAVGDTWVLTGGNGTADDGGLYVSGDLGMSWSRIRADVDGDGTATPADDLGACQHLDDCDVPTAKPISSGRLLVTDPADPQASLLYIASQDPDTRGIWVLDRDTSSSSAPDLCAAYDPTTLPTAAALGGSRDAIPSALVFQWPEGDASPTLLIGYRPVVVDDPAALPDVDLNALYLCPALSAANMCAQPACLPVVDEMDGDTIGSVRDIAADPVVPGRLYVLDDGRRWQSSVPTRDGSGAVTGYTYTCSQSEPSVWAVDVRRADDGSLSFAIWDTDDESLTAPSWNVSAAHPTPQPYYDPNINNACIAASAPSYGNLIAPTYSATAIGRSPATIMVDPAGEWLVTLFPWGDSQPIWGCARAFRAPLTGLDVDTPLPWAPLQGYEHGNMFYSTSPHARTRRESVETCGGFMEDEPLAEAWPSGGEDAVFVDAGNGNADLLVGGNFLWWVPYDAAPADTLAPAGWDTLDPTKDLDTIPYTLAFDGPVTRTTYQDASTFSTAVWPASASCDGGYRDQIIAGIGDYKAAILYGGEDRPAADRRCNLQPMSSFGTEVCTWNDPYDPSMRQMWMTLNATGSTVANHADNGLGRGLLYARANAADWCWDGIGAGNKIAGYNFLTTRWDSGAWHLYCQDQGVFRSEYPAWDACRKDSASPFNLQRDGVGVPRNIVALGEGVAVLTAAPACMTTGCDGSEAVTSGQGLWVVWDEDADGLRYTHVPFPSTGEISAGASCDERALFEHTAQPQLVVHPLSGAEEGAAVSVFVTSRGAGCGLVEVDFTLHRGGTPTDVTWTRLPTSGVSGGCDLGENTLLGAAIAPDGQWLMAFGGGGAEADATSTQSKGGVCAIALADPDYADGGGQTQVVERDEARFAIRAMLAHPHLQGIWWFSTVVDAGCYSCDTPAIYELEHQYAPATGTWTWVWDRVSDDTLGYKEVWDLDWGAGMQAEPTDPVLRDLYVSATGGGFWDARVEW